jgi:hypothetical protein
MAKVKLPLLSADVSGKFGDVVFFKRGSVRVARVKVKPANPRTEKQQTIRANMKGLGLLWRHAGEDFTTTLYKKTTDQNGNVTYQEVQVNAQNINKDAWKSCVMYSDSGFPLKGYQVFAATNLLSSHIPRSSFLPSRFIPIAKCNALF